MVFLALFWKFSPDMLLFAKYSVLFAFLIPVFFIDWYHQLILDKMTIPMAIIGLAFALIPGTDVSFKNALVTGVGILVLMLIIAWIYEKVRKVDGMGGGDIKLLAAMATYLGAINISFIIFISSIIAVIGAISTSKTRKEGIPFGPFIVVATLFWVLFGNHFLSWYLNIL
jgi:leader peptidase (prepilin peptidase)/N-methyltransferase